MKQQNSVHEQSAELVLSAITMERGGGLFSSFFFGRPGAPLWDRRYGVDIYYRRKDLIRAALFVRQHGPSYLRYLPIDDIWSMLQKFVSENFWYLADDVFLKQLKGSLAGNVSARAKAEFAAALRASTIFVPSNEVMLFPLSVVRVDADFDAEGFFLIAPESLTPDRLPGSVDLRQLKPAHFPPLSDWKGLTQVPSAWLGVRSPAPKASEKMKAAILGAIALTPLPRYRHMFSGRKVAHGRATFGPYSVTISLDGTHTPPVMHDVCIGGDDHAWLAALSGKLLAAERAVRRQL